MQTNSLQIILLLLVLFPASVRNSLLLIKENTRETALVNAVVHIISEEKTEIPTTVHFVYTRQADILTLIVAGIRNFSTYSIEKRQQVSECYRWRFAIILIDDHNDFLEFSKKLEKFHRRAHYIIVVRTMLPTRERLDLSKRIFEEFFDSYYDNVNILFADETGGQVFMYTFFPCSTAHVCYEVVPVLYNTFDGKQFRKAIPHFPKKWTNFNGCPLVVSVYNFPPHIMATQSSDDRWNVEGIDGKIFLGIASRLNFTMKFIQSPNRGHLFSNGSATDSMNVLLHGPANLTLGGLFQTADRAVFFAPSQGYLQIDVVFALSPPQEYGSLERLLLPLKFDVWLIYHATAFSAFIFLTILKRYGGKYRRFIIGDHSRGPFLEMYQTVTGIGLAKAPKYSFARSLFAIWLVAGLILSTYYRSKSFGFLVSKVTKRMPETIDEMKAMEYELYIPELMLDRILSFYGDSSRINIIYSYAGNFYPLLQRGHRLALSESKILVDYFNALNFRNGVLPVLPEKIYTGTIAMYFKKHSYLEDPFNSILKGFAKSGLIEKWTNDVLNITSLSSLQKDHEPKALSLFNLAGIFQISALLMGCSLLMFIAELMSLRSNRLRRIVLFYTETD